MGRIVNRAEFAEIIGKSPRTVGEMIAQGLPANRLGKKGAEVRIDTETAIAWLIRREVAKLTGGGTEESGSREEEELRLIKANADYRELQVAKERAELVALADVQQALNGVMVIVGSQLDSLAGRLAGKLADMNDSAQIRELLLDECRRIRVSAANRLEDFAGDPPRGEPLEAAAEAPAVEMG